MEQRIFHGEISPEIIAQKLIAHFNRGNLKAQQLGNGSQVAVQIATKSTASSGGQTALSINIQKVADGVSIYLGKQAWLGIAASLGFTALTALRNPFSLLGRIDDLAQDIEYLQLSEDVWQVINDTMDSLGASHELSERLKRIVCPYCSSGNKVGESNCIACGAPLGDLQPKTCINCGFVLDLNENKCPNCGEIQ